jgi:uncharacterized membrane protein YkvA (DUF1232 family)
MKNFQKSKMNKKQEEFAEGEEPLEEKGLLISETWIYKIFVKSAYRLINKPLAVLRLLKQTINHMQRYENVKEFTKDVKTHLNTLIRLVQAYAKGEYRGVSLQGIALTVAALIYFVAPLDFIPDFLVIGLIDDIALMMWVYKNYSKEIEAFLEWEDNKKVRIELPLPSEEKQIQPDPEGE